MKKEMEEAIEEMKKENPLVIRLLIYKLAQRFDCKY
jgi:hypothetical protein